MFCTLVKRGFGDALAYEDELWVVTPSLHQRPTNLGHMLIVPKGHWRDLHDMPPVFDASFMSLARKVSRAVITAFGADGTTLRQNNGHPGQRVFHFHGHVNARFDHPSDMTGGVEVVGHDALATQALAVASFM